MLARVGIATHSIDETLYALILSTAVVTMLLTPFAARAATPIYGLLRRRFSDGEPLQLLNVSEGKLHDHVIVAGAGRVGQHVARVLAKLGIPFVAIELDYGRVEQCKEQGLPIIFGDASHPVVLAAAHLDKAHLLLITTPSIDVTGRIVEHMKAVRPDLHIVARAEGVEQMEMLYKMGVYEVVQPEFEAGLEITRQALLHMDLPATEIQRYTDSVRHEHYRPLINMHEDYRTIMELQHAQGLLELHWMTIDGESQLVGHTLEEAQIRRHTGASVVAIVRNGNVMVNPKAQERFTPGDRIGILGSHDVREHFLAHMHGEHM